MAGEANLETALVSLTGPVRFFGFCVLIYFRANGGELSNDRKTNLWPIEIDKNKKI